MMAIVMPTAAMPTKALCRKTLMKLSGLLKAGMNRIARIQTSSSTALMPKRSHMRSQSRVRRDAAGVIVVALMPASARGRVDGSRPGY